MQSTRLPWALLSLALASSSACSPARDRETASAASDTAMRHHDSMKAANTAPATPTAIHTGNPKIDEALSAAPSAVAQNATVMDWPDSAGGQPKELRHGTNGWTCFPASPAATGAAGKDPMCLDQEFMAWGNAWESHKPPRLKGVAIAYMLQGDVGASNTDPYAKDSTADNHWVQSGPHMMVATPNVAQLAAISTDPGNGGPWVMWKGTPYAHVMVPAQ